MLCVDDRRTSDLFFATDGIIYRPRASSYCLLLFFSPFLWVHISAQSGNDADAGPPRSTHTILQQLCKAFPQADSRLAHDANRCRARVRCTTTTAGLRCYCRL